MRKKASRFLGGILLVSGTSIGAGMLALPVISSFGGFFPFLALLFLCWAFLFATAWILLDVTLWFSKEVNLVTMADKTLGKAGKIFCWVVYLLLLYSLTAAYIAASAPLFLGALESMTGVIVPQWIGPLPLLFLFAFFVYWGTRAVDWVNRVLMFGLASTYFLLVVFLPHHVEGRLLEHVDFKAAWIAVPVLITSFGFHIIIPTLSTYLERDKKRLRLILFWGSLIPFFVYALWEVLILGVVPLEGKEGLIQAYLQGKSGAALLLSQAIDSFWTKEVAKSFSFFAVLTSFLGVSLSLADFLSDGLKLKRFGLEREIICLLTFVPPLLFVLFYKRGFLLALQFAGVFVALLLCILPALMAWKLYKGRMKKALLLVVIALSLGVITLDVLEELGALQALSARYTQKNL